MWWELHGNKKRWNLKDRWGDQSGGEWEPIKFCFQTLKMNPSLQLRWSKRSNQEHISEPVISWLQNVPNSHMRPAKQTDRKSDTEKSESVQNRVANKCWFQQHEILFSDVKLKQMNSDWDEILHTPGEICFQGLHKFWAQSDLWINRRSENTNRMGFCWGFLKTNSKRTQLGSRPRTAPWGRMQWSKESISTQINPQQHHIKRTRRFSTKPQVRGKGETKNTRTSEIPARVQTEIWSQRTLWAGLATLPRIKLED